MGDLSKDKSWEEISTDTNPEQEKGKSLNVQHLMEHKRGIGGGFLFKGTGETFSMLPTQGSTSWVLIGSGQELELAPALEGSQNPAAVALCAVV